VTVAAALLCTTIVYFCLFSYAGSVAAIAGGFAFATSPEIWRATSYLLSEIPFMLLYTLAVIFFFRGLYVDSRSFTIAWPCFAMALMTRYMAVLFGPTCAVLVAVPLLSRDREAIARMRTPHFLIGPILAALFLAPMFVRAWINFGDPLTGFRAAAQQLPDYSRHAQMPLLHYFSLLPSMLGWLPTLVLAASVADIAARRDKLGITCAIAALVIIAWHSQYGWKEPRLISAALPFMAIAIGLGLSSAGSRLGAAVPTRHTLSQRVGLALVVLAIIAGIRFDPSYARAVREILTGRDARISVLPLRNGGDRTRDPCDDGSRDDGSDGAELLPDQLVFGSAMSPVAERSHSWAKPVEPRRASRRRRLRLGDLVRARPAPVH
jgi:hypothetical protein